MHTLKLICFSDSKVPAAMTDEYNNKHNDFLDFNKVVYPPFKEGDLIRPAVRPIHTHKNTLL